MGIIVFGMGCIVAYRMARSGDPEYAAVTVFLSGWIASWVKVVA